ncbi:FHA domain-containing protein [Paraburkholderia heleia]|uniref:hypothetical protein n=1 Tax=Paraburkholderia heleia TaxID=634127 RepID=UPI0012EE0AB7|nr:hypothetical protein [Paraburkholderia heleia]
MQRSANQGSRKKRYKDLQDHVQAKIRRVVQTCWIADRKEANGLRVNSRRIGPRVKPCPPQYAAVIDSAMRDLGWLD